MNFCSISHVVISSVFLLSPVSAIAQNGSIAPGTGYYTVDAAPAAAPVPVTPTEPHRRSLHLYRDIGADRGLPDQASVDEIKAIIAREAGHEGVPPLLAEAIVQHESRFHAGARTENNTIGLMQIKLGTARGMGYQGDAAGLFRPENNIHFGVAYLGAAWRLAHGDVCGTLARYAGGFAVTGGSGPTRAFCAMAKSYMVSHSKA